MSDISPRLGLPFLLPGQAQKHVTLNEALRRLDLVAQMGVRSRAIAAQPASPAEGDAYILPAGATGAAWAGAPENAVAAFVGGGWSFVMPRRGWWAFVEDEACLVMFATAGAGAGWSREAGAAAGAARNLLINARFQVNQRGFAGGSLPAGTYGPDRWKAGTGGCSVSFSGEVVTLSSGELVQVVEAPGLAGQGVTLGVDSPTAPISVAVRAAGSGSGSV